MITKILGWFTGGASTFLPWAVVFGAGLVMGAGPTYKLMDLRYDAYKGSVAEANLKAVTEAYAKGKVAGEKAAEVRKVLDAKQKTVTDSKQKVDDEILKAAVPGSKFTSADCAWPPSVRDSYNAVGTSAVPRRLSGN